MKKTILFAAILSLAMFKSNTSNAQGIALPFLENFDSTTSNTWNQWDLNSNHPATIVHVQAQSAYGVDSGSLMINLWAAGSLTEWYIQSPVFENSNSRKKLELSFDFAAAVRHVGPIMIPNDYAEDYLRIYGSTDSGASYSFVDSFKIGLDGILNTGGRSTSVFNPADTQWTSMDGIYLPIGTNRVQFQIFRMYNNRNGNMAYLDNVNIAYCFANAPEGDTVQVDSTYTTVADLEVNGGNLKWFLDAALTQEVTDTTSLTDSTYYYVTQTVDDCESDALAIFYTDGKQDPVGIDQLKSFGINVYPNPVTNTLVIDGNTKIDKVSIWTVTGKTVAHMSMINNKIDVSSLPSGMYFLSLDVAGQILRHKFIKE